MDDFPSYVVYRTREDALAKAKETGESVLISEDVFAGFGMLAYPTGCVVQSGGRDGDGFCYEHQSFDCGA